MQGEGFARSREEEPYGKRRFKARGLINFAVRYYPNIQRFYQRKKAKTQGVVAIKAVAHKLARACYYVLRDHVPFEIDKAFASPT